MCKTCVHWKPQKASEKVFRNWNKWRARPCLWIGRLGLQTCPHGLHPHRLLVEIGKLASVTCVQMLSTQTGWTALRKIEVEGLSLPIAGFLESRSKQTASCAFKWQRCPSSSVRKVVCWARLPEQLDVSTQAVACARHRVNSRQIKDLSVGTGSLQLRRKQGECVLTSGGRDSWGRWKPHHRRKKEQIWLHLNAKLHSKGS